MTGFTHESTYNESVEWYTPPEIFEALQVEFALDPCSPPDGPVPWIPAERHYSVYDDGLRQPWDGPVWMNPPYGSHTPRWMERLAHHGDGIGLVFARTDTAWFHDWASKADLICFVRGRIRFFRSNYERAGSPGAGSLLVAFGRQMAQAVYDSELGLCMEVRHERP